MASGRKTSLRLLGVVLFGAALYGGYWLWEILLIGTAYEAKVLCSSVFVSRRDPQQVLTEELEGIFEIVDSEVDRDNLTVTARLPGMPEQRAVYRAGLGCTLLAGVPEAELRQQASGLSVGAGEGGRVGEAPDPSSGEPVSSGAPPPASDALRRALAGAFAEPDPSRPVRTRALVVQHHGRVVAERYAPRLQPGDAAGGLVHDQERDQRPGGDPGEVREASDR